MRPLPGSATEADVLRMLERRNKRYELIDGTIRGRVIVNVNA